MNSLLNTVLILIAVLTLVACQDDDTVDNQAPNREFNTIEAMWDPTPLVSPRHLDAFNGERTTFSLLGIAPGADARRIALQRFVRSNTPNGDRDEYLVHDLDSAELITLLAQSPLFATSISRDQSSAAWIEECQGFVQRFAEMSEGVRFNPLLRNNTCLRPPTISENGRTAIFGSARGRLNDSDELVFSEFDSTQYGPVIYDATRGTVQSLAGVDLDLGVAEFDALVPLLDTLQLDASGTHIAVRTSFVPSNYLNAGTIDFTAALLLVDVDTNVVKLVDPHTERHAFCQKCSIPYARDVALSGDGNVLWFLRPAELADSRPPPLSRLYRHDLQSNETVMFTTQDRVSAGSLVTSHDGNEVAYVAAEDTVLLRYESRERMTLDRAMRACSDTDCVLESYRYVRNSPLTLSADGSTLLISVIPELAGIDTPQNTEEILLLDSDSKRLQRLAPGIGIDRVAISDDGMSIVFQSESDGLIPDDDDFDSDLFIIER